MGEEEAVDLSVRLRVAEEFGEVGEDVDEAGFIISGELRAGRGDGDFRFEIGNFKVGVFGSVGLNERIRRRAGMSIQNEIWSVERGARRLQRQREEETESLRD